MIISPSYYTKCTISLYAFLVTEKSCLRYLFITWMMSISIRPIPVVVQRGYDCNSRSLTSSLLQILGLRFSIPFGVSYFVPLPYKYDVHIDWWCYLIHDASIKNNITQDECEIPCTFFCPFFLYKLYVIITVDCMLWFDHHFLDKQQGTLGSGTIA